jgi:hypothetical protein
MKKYQSAKKNESVISENGWKANVNVGESWPANGYPA